MPQILMSVGLSTTRALKLQTVLTLMAVMSVCAGQDTIKLDIIAQVHF